MIIQQLCELAHRERLLDDIAFEELPLPWIVCFDIEGRYLGLEDHRGVTLIPSKKKGGDPKQVLDKGKLRLIPRAHGNTCGSGFARYFVDTLPRVLPLIVEEKTQAKFDSSRATFWRQITQAADESKLSSLLALHRFGQRLDEFAEQIRTDIAAYDPAMTDRVSFRYIPDEKILVENEDVRCWYSDFYARTDATKQGSGRINVCQVTGEVGPVPTSHAFKFQGIPNGMSAGVSLISFDKASFAHYGLEGTENASIGYAAAAGYIRALDALIKGSLPSIRKHGGCSKLVFGNALFVFWTKDPENTKVMSLFDSPDDEGLARLSTGNNTDQFHVLGLSANAARVVVRCYFNREVSAVKANIARWFSDIEIADTTKEFAGNANNKFPIWQLAAATSFDTASIEPDVSERLLESAVTGGPVAGSLLSSCLRRFGKGRGAFHASRMALVKVVLTRKGYSVASTLNLEERNTGYLYGRLLSVLEQIQYAALGEVNANVVDKFYGVMSACPGLVVGRLQQYAQHHLRKLRGEKSGTAWVLEQLLMSITDVIPVVPASMRLSTQDQGMFALGYYHQKAKAIEDAAARREARMLPAED